MGAGGGHRDAARVATEVPQEGAGRDRRGRTATQLWLLLETRKQASIQKGQGEEGKESRRQSPRATKVRENRVKRVKHRRYIKQE